MRNSRKKMMSMGIVLVSLFAILSILGCQTTPPVEEAPQGDPSWSKVERSGVLLVGTSSGYPPYEYYDENNTLTGFDIALINAVANKLGVRASISDFAFDGLGAALSVNQIDAAIAAISDTPERAAQVNFSNVYLVGSDAILAQKGSPITSVKTPADMANKRVGVERGTVYETWVQTNLVNTGLIQPNQMFVYEQAKHAVNDLSLGRLDLVMADLRPSTVATQNFDVVLVGQGLNQQRFAIAMKLNANELTKRINDALIQLQNEGVIAELQKEYLNLDAADAHACSHPRAHPGSFRPHTHFRPHPGRLRGWHAVRLGSLLWRWQRNILPGREPQPELPKGLAHPEHRYLYLELNLFPEICLGDPDEWAEYRRAGQCGTGTEL